MEGQRGEVRLRIDVVVQQEPRRRAALYAGRHRLRRAPRWSRESLSTGRGRELATTRRPNMGDAPAEGRQGHWGGDLHAVRRRPNHDEHTEEHSGLYAGLQADLE